VSWQWEGWTQEAANRSRGSRQQFGTPVLPEYQRRGLGDASLAKFNEYVQGGTDKKMPKGLVFYTL
jgi:hypothetical protein